MKKRLSVLVLALAMILTMSASVFAGTSDYTGPSASLAQAAMVKELDIASGVSIPTATFTFKFEAVAAGQDGMNSTAPAIANQTLSFGSSDTITNDKIEKHIALSSLFTLGENGNLKSAGQYSYKVTETGTSFVDTDNEKMICSKAEYMLRLYVTNGANGPECNIITVDKIKDDAGTAQTTTGDAAKVDATDENLSDTTETSQFRFVNSFHKEIVSPEDPTDPTDPDDPTTGKYGVMGVSKTVKGEYADKEAKFPFSITITAPSTYDPAVDGASFAYTEAGASKTLSFTKNNSGVYTATITPALANGESVGFKKLPAGTKFSTTETLGASSIENKTKYAPVAALGSAPTDPADGTVYTNDASTAEKTIGDTDAANANTAFYTNKFADDAITPTGIIINNLPYVLLIGIALGGIILFSRKRRYE